MNVLFFILLTSVTAGAVVYVFLTTLLAWVRFRGTRLVTCPETGKSAAVALASFKAALAAPFSKPKAELSACSRWPEHAGCGRDCLTQVASSPDGCLLRAIVDEWYAGQTCALCGRSFGELSAAEHRPALLTPGGATVQWHEVAAETLPDLFRTHRPVCWNCHVVRTVTRLRPDAVIVRPPHPDPQHLPS